MSAILKTFMSTSEKKREDNRDDSHHCKITAMMTLTPSPLYKVNNFIDGGT